jgi:hypothetical protein
MSLVLDELVRTLELKATGLRLDVLLGLSKQLLSEHPLQEQLGEAEMQRVLRAGLVHSDASAVESVLHWGLELLLGSLQMRACRCD